MYKFIKTVIIFYLLLIGSHEILAQNFPNGYQKLECCGCANSCSLIADSNPSSFNTADSQLFLLVDVDNGTVDGDDDDNLIDALSTNGYFLNVPLGDYVMYSLSFDPADSDAIDAIVQEGLGINNLINLGTQSGANTWYSSNPSFTLIATDLATVSDTCCYIALELFNSVDGETVDVDWTDITVYIYDAAGNLVGETSIVDNSYTNFLGFNNLPDGDYYLVVDAPDEFLEGLMTTHSDVVFDESGVSNVFTLPILGIYPEIDEGYYEGDFEYTDSSEDSNSVTVVCEDFNAIATAICSTDKSTYNVLLSFLGGDAGDNGYNILSNNTGTSFNNITAPTMNLGPFDAGTGFSYTVSVADHPECTIVLTTATVDCIVTAIELQNFIGDVLREGNEIMWTTASENNTDFYTVEYSMNGVDFKEAGIVRGGGNSSVSQQYVYLHEIQEDGEYYYRLRETELEGHSSIVSDVISLRRLSNGFAITNVYPVPTSDWINIDVATENNDEFTIELMDITGKILETKTHTAIIGNNQISINATSLRAGTYFIAISNGQEKVIDKFVKN